MRPYDKLLARWAETDPDIRTTAEPEARLQALEERVGLSLPDDFREYLARCCPVDESSWDDATCWWNLDRIKTLAAEYGHPLANRELALRPAEFLVFADYAIWCMAWAIDCSAGPSRGRVIVISGDERYCADSFAAFVDQHVVNVRELL